MEWWWRHTDWGTGCDRVLNDGHKLSCPISNNRPGVYRRVLVSRETITFRPDHGSPSRPIPSSAYQRRPETGTRRQGPGLGLSQSLHRWSRAQDVLG